MRDGDQWVINGSKMWITNSLQADWLCLLARTSDDDGYSGMSQIIVPTETEGFCFKETRQARHAGFRYRFALFDDCRVPVSNTIGEIGRGFQQQMSQFVVERMWAAYSCIGACELALERTAEYLRERHAFVAPTRQSTPSVHACGASAELDLLRSYNYSIADKYQRASTPPGRRRLQN